MPNYTPKHCTARENKQCWECYQGFVPRVFEAEIIMKRAELTTTCSKVLENPSQHLTIDLCAIAHAYVDLINCQWQEMVRGPFEIALSLSDIMAKVKPITEPMKRRI